MSKQWVQITNPERNAAPPKDRLFGRFAINADGSIAAVARKSKSRNASNNPYHPFSLMMRGPLSEQNRKYVAFINVNLLFEPKTLIQHTFLNNRVTIHGYVPLAFVPSKVIDVEYTNWNY